MVTVLREDGLRVVIFVNDHVPAHVHVFADGEAKITMSKNGETELVWAVGMTKGDVRRAVRLVERHRDFLLERWMDIHG